MVQRKVEKIIFSRTYEVVRGVGQIALAFQKGSGLTSRRKGQEKDGEERDSSEDMVPREAKMYNL